MKNINLEQGAFCGGGCGDDALCYNNTCQCSFGFRGNPKIKCYGNSKLYFLLL